MQYNLVKGHHTGLTVRSLSEALHFYRDLLGMEEVFNWEPKAQYLRKVTGYNEADFHIAVLKIPGIDYFLELLEYRNIEHVEIDHGNGNPGIGHISFQVDHVDEWFEFLSQKGIKSVSPPVTPTTGPNKGGRVVYMIDPDGFRVELIETKNSFADFRPTEY